MKAIERRRNDDNDADAIADGWHDNYYNKWICLSGLTGLTDPDAILETDVAKANKKFSESQHSQVFVKG